MCFENLRSWKSLGGSVVSSTFAAIVEKVAADTEGQCNENIYPSGMI